MESKRQEITRDILVAMIENDCVKHIDDVTSHYKQIFNVVNQSMNVYNVDSLLNDDFIKSD